MGFLELLVLMALPSATGQILPRQTDMAASFSNTSSTSVTPTTTADASAITQPPPCCWVIGGTFAVGVNRWWSTSVEEVVATVITNIGRYDDNSTKVLNTTTIYKGVNATLPASVFGTYLANTAYYLSADFSQVGLVLPTDILTGQGAFLSGAGDYAATAVENKTAMSFDFTDLVIPPVFDNYTGTLPIKTYGSSMCGHWSTDSYYTRVSTGLTTYSRTFPYSDDLSAITTSTSIGDYGLFSTKFTSTAAPTFWPNGMDTDKFFIGGPFPGGASNNSLSSGYSDWGASNFDRTYVSVKATQVPDGQAALALPTGLLPWLASNQTLSSMYPFLTDCWTLWGVGQPTVHAAVNQLTTSSDNIIEMGAPATTKAIPTPTTRAPTPDPYTEPTAEPVSENTPTVASPNTPSTPTTASPNTPQDNAGQGSDTLTSLDGTAPSPTPANTDGAEPASPTTANNPPTTQNNDGPTSQAPNPVNTDSGDDDTIIDNPVGTITTSDDLGNLLGAISSVANEQSTDAAVFPAGTNDAQEPPSAATTATAESTELGNLLGAISSVANGQSTTAAVAAAGPPSTLVSQTSPSPATTGPAVFSGQTVDRGTPTIINGETVSVSGNNIVIASGFSTRTEVLAATSTYVVVYQGQTVDVNRPTVIGGQTVSVSGNDIIIASGSSTRTEKIVATSTPTAIYNGQTVGSTPTVINGQTVSVSGNDLIIASGSSTRTEAFAATTTSAAVYNGQTIDPGTPTVIGDETVSVSGNNVIVASGSSTRTQALDASSAIIDGQTVHEGVPTVINGETVSLSGTALVVASGSATRTEGLGGAIISGIGGSSDATDSVAPAAAPTNGGNGRTMERQWVVYVVAMIGVVRAI
ncbi:hypothetical protein LTS10_011284 [Elasticomyces elasticus]|nr:hypothetical protein LTS10_011284 [Elasticomyces elasticus]